MGSEEEGGEVDGGIFEEVKGGGEFREVAPESAEREGLGGEDDGAGAGEGIVAARLVKRGEEDFGGRARRPANRSTVVFGTVNWGSDLENEEGFPS